MKLCGIYLLTHIESGRKYVGQSRDIHGRWVGHARGYGKTFLARAIRQHGWGAFRADIVELCGPDQLNEREARLIDAIGTLMPNGFNLTTGGLYFKQSPDVVARTVAFHTGRKRSPETCERIGAAKRGMKHSDETKAKIAAGNVGKVVSVATRAKLSIASMHQTWTAEARAKIGAANAARVYTAAERAKRSAAHLGKKLSPEHVEKARAARAANRLLRTAIPPPSAESPTTP